MTQDDLFGGSLDALMGVQPYHRDARLSPDERYRYELTRVWVDPPASAELQMATFVMLNPSRADASVDDPTLGRCVEFAKREGMRGVRLINLYAYRATSPQTMWAAQQEGVNIVGPENDDTIQHVAAASLTYDSPFIVAWGAGADPGRVDVVRKLLSGINAQCLGVTKDGHPRHPLYVKGDTPLTRWRG
jgi:hypothetical protein